MNRIPVRDPAARRLRWKRRTTLLRRGCWRVAAKCWKLRMQPPRDKSGNSTIEIGDISWFSWGYKLYIYIYTMQHEGIQWLMMILLVVEHICLIFFPIGWWSPLLIFFRRLEGLKPPTGTDWKGHGRGWKIYIYIYIDNYMYYIQIYNHKNGRWPSRCAGYQFQCYRGEREKPFCCGG